MDKEIKMIPLICKECKQEYEAREIDVLGMKMVFGKDYCSACSKKKLEEEEQRNVRLHELELKNKRELWQNTCRIPLRFVAQRFDTFQSNRSKSLSNAYKDCVDYAEKFSIRGCRGYRSLVLYSEGVWGVGKSHLVTSIAHHILDKSEGEIGYCPVRYTSEPNLFLRIRSTFNRQQGEGYHETEAVIFRELTTVPLLIIDDVGKEEVSDPRFVQRVLFAIINGRYDNMLPVIITANSNTDILERHLGGDRGNSATFDRLTEMTCNMFREIIATTYRDYKNR